ncbi:EthD domain-containing protein [Sinisalibacter aestuarii]|nr:EthD domain-containing protein [Sinisalibacter aestuarii]
MALMRTKMDLTEEQVSRGIADLPTSTDPNVLGQVFNRVSDSSQKGISYARGSFEPDAISQFFFGDISASMMAAHAGGVGLSMCVPQHVIEQMELILCLQNTVLKPPADKGGLKRMSILRKRPDVSDEEFQDQWFNMHSILVKRLPGIQGYRQNLVLDGARNAAGERLVDGMVELWFPDGETIEAAFRSDAGITTMTHAKEFISEINTYLVQPHEISGCA